MYRYGENIGHWIAWHSKVKKDKEAIVFEDQRVTYGAFNQKVNQIAHYLRSSFHIEKGDRVACYLDNCMEFLELTFACAKIGARLVTLNYRLKGGELEYIIRDCDPRVIFTSDSLCGTLRSAVLWEGDTMRILTVTSEEYLAGVALEDNSEPSQQACWDDDFAILYTSGTTGLPKGVVFTHDNVRVSTLQRILAFGFDGSEKSYNALPLCFSGALIGLAMPMFHIGGTFVVDQCFSPERFLERVQRDRITLFSGVPVMLKRISDLPEFETADFSSLKRIGLGGAPVPDALADIFRMRCGFFYRAYALTEGGVINMYTPSVACEKKSAYYPMIMNDMRVVRPDGQEVAPGEVGEITIKGPLMMRGYWNNPEATAECLRDGWLYTGDLGTTDEEGYLYISGRKKDMIISGGLNIYCAEVENVLFKHPDVQDVSVIGVPHEEWGEGVVAVVILQPGSTAGKEELIHFCRDQLACYKRPQKIIFVDALPRNASGKVLKPILRKRYHSLFTGGK